MLVTPTPPVAPSPVRSARSPDFVSTVKLQEKKLTLEGEPPPPTSSLVAVPPTSPTQSPHGTSPWVAHSGEPDRTDWPPEALAVLETQPERAAAIRFFDRECKRLRVVADEMDRDIRGWVGACQGKTSTGSGYVQGIDGQLTFVQSIAINNESTPYCQQLLVEARAAADKIRREMPEAFNQGRRMGLFPGDVRNATHKYGLGSQLWE